MSERASSRPQPTATGADGQSALARASREVRTRGVQAVPSTKHPRRTEARDRHNGQENGGAFSPCEQRSCCHRSSGCPQVAVSGRSSRQSHRDSLLRMAEDDYMSDAFLLEATKQSTRADDVGRFGALGARLGRKRAAKRPADEPEEAPAAGPQSMFATLQRGLSKPIPESNVGHKLLMKMGYKAGQPLGKGAAAAAAAAAAQSTDASGLEQQPEVTTSRRAAVVEPINVLADALKPAREGLGVATARAEKQQQSERLRVAAETVRKRAFVAVTSEQFNQQRIAATLDRARVVCERLDRAADIESNPLWGPPVAAAAPDDADWPPGAVPHQRRELTDAELALVEAGASVKDAVAAVAAAAAAAAPVNVRPFGHARLRACDAIPAQVAEELERVLLYLRNRHLYCFFCAVRYSDDDDMATNCPGVFEKDHD
jgi:hypothetical protein